MVEQKVFILFAVGRKIEVKITVSQKYEASYTSQKAKLNNSIIHHTINYCIIQHILVWLNYGYLLVY
jgi:hypothetical protein